MGAGASTSKQTGNPKDGSNLNQPLLKGEPSLLYGTKKAGPPTPNSAAAITNDHKSLFSRICCCCSSLFSPKSQVIYTIKTDFLDDIISDFTSSQASKHINKSQPIGLNDAENRKLKKAIYTAYQSYQDPPNVDTLPDSIDALKDSVTEALNHSGYEVENPYNAWHQHFLDKQLYFSREYFDDYGHHPSAMANICDTLTTDIINDTLAKKNHESLELLRDITENLLNKLKSETSTEDHKATFKRALTNLAKSLTTAYHNSPSDEDPSDEEWKIRGMLSTEVGFTRKTDNPILAALQGKINDLQGLVNASTGISKK
jgi:hypothetical protein